jgi:tetratricopeptide (TPR) repeat protein
MREPGIKAAIAEAVACYNAGKFSRAEEIYRWVVSRAPNATRYADLGAICRKQGKHDEAIAFLKKAVELEPKSADHHFKLGDAFFRHGKTEDALRSWCRVIELQPRHADALSWLGCLYVEAGQLDRSVAHFRRAIVANPRHYYAHDNLGIALRKKGELEEAIQCHLRAIALKPDQPEAYTHLGTTYSEIDRLEDAIASHQKAVAVDPAFSGAHCNLGTAYVGALRLEDAIRSYERALELEPGNGHYHWNYSNALLLAGDYDKGWKEYEWRWQAPELKKPRPDFPGPAWQGEDIAGKTILLHGEQGFGDVIQFIRYASLVADRGARVLFVSPPQLARLVSNAKGISQVAGVGQPLPGFDLHFPLLSLARAFNTRLSTVPSSVPYIRADDTLVAAWRARMENDKSFRVGVIWGGRTTHPQDRKRSCALSDLAPIARSRGVQLYSLQKGEQAAQAKSPHAMSLIDWTDELGDFADTAALMANLDLIISVDTAGAHLAGALGRPVWLLNRYQTEWRWLLDREDSPWYPTMRIFRQPRLGDWQTVMESVAAELEQLAASERQ